jgi:hypothetical protein
MFAERSYWDSLLLMFTTSGHDSLKNRIPDRRNRCPLSDRRRREGPKTRLADPHHAFERCPRARGARNHATFESTNRAALAAADSACARVTPSISPPSAAVRRPTPRPADLGVSGHRSSSQSGTPKRLKRKGNQRGVESTPTIVNLTVARRHLPVAAGEVVDRGT